MSLQRERIAKGQCPRCGKEAAPYRLCFDHRLEARFTRNLNRGAKVGALTKEKRINGIYFGLPKVAPLNPARWGTTPIILPESDRRGRPRLHGSTVDVEATMLKVIEHIGRPCTLEEITEAWGKLRSRRNDPLPSDLAQIIKAADKRKRRARKLAEIEARHEQQTAQ